MQRLEQAQQADAEPRGPVLGMEERSSHWAAMITVMLEARVVMRLRESKNRWATMVVATLALTASLLTRTASAVDCVTSRGKPAFTTCRVD